MNALETSRYAEYLPQNLKGKTIFITGGTTGIGRATALLLGALGNDIFIVGRHQQELDDTIKDYREFTSEGSISGITADLSVQEDILKAYREIDSRFDRIDILINNAALGFKGITEGSAVEWEYVIKSNLLAYISCAREAVDRMKKSGGGHIVNIGSMSADDRAKDSSIYTATKSGIQGFNEALRKEINEFGIKVSLIEPGKAGTDMQPESPEEQRTQEAELKMLKAEDVAAAVLYILLNPKRSEIVSLQIKPFKQIL